MVSFIYEYLGYLLVSLGEGRILESGWKFEGSRGKENCGGC